MESEDTHHILCSVDFTEYAAADLWTAAADFFDSPPYFTESRVEHLNRLWSQRRKGADTVLPDHQARGAPCPLSILMIPSAEAGGAE